MHIAHTLWASIQEDEIKGSIKNLAVFWDYIDVSLRKEKMRYGPI